MCIMINLYIYGLKCMFSSVNGILFFWDEYRKWTNLLCYVISSLLNGLSDTILWALCVSASCLCPQANCFSKSDLINCAYRSIPYSRLIWFSDGQGPQPMRYEPGLSHCFLWAPRPAASRRRQCGRQGQQPMRHERWAVNHHPLGPSTENASLDKGEFNWQLTMNNLTA